MVLKKRVVGWRLVNAPSLLVSVIKNIIFD